MGSMTSLAEAAAMIDVLRERGYDLNAVAAIADQEWFAMIADAVARRERGA
jgi:hypothetical protein